MRKFLLPAFLSVLFGSPILAGPDATTQRLMDDSPSMLDWGVFRLEQALNDGHEEKVRVSYIWDDNIIRIQHYSFSENASETVARAKCVLWIRSIRREAGVDDETGSLSGWTVNSWFTDYFTHNGFTRTQNGVDLEEVLPDLDKKFRLRWIEQFSLEEGGTNSLTCTAPLIGTSISYEVS